MASSNLSAGIPGGPWQRRTAVWTAVLVIAVLVWVLLDRVEDEARRAERRAVDLMIGQLQAQILLRETEGRMKRHESVTELEGGNPMDWLRLAPAQYLGLCGELSELEPGYWCFQKDRPGGVLGYRLRFSEQGAGDPFLAWRVKREAAKRSEQGRLQLVPLTQADLSRRL